MVAYPEAMDDCPEAEITQTVAQNIPETQLTRSNPHSCPSLSILPSSNIANMVKRYLLAVGVVILFCSMLSCELWVYIRLRQAYLTSPLHRRRARATTWLTVEALVGLYDLFPGVEKVEERNNMAKNLEAAEMELIKMAKKKKMMELSKKASSSAENAQITDPAAGRGDISIVDDGIHRLGHCVIGGITTITGGVRRLRGEVEDRMPDAAWGYQAGGANLLSLRKKGSTLAQNEAVSRENSNGSPQQTRTLPTIDAGDTGVANLSPCGKSAGSSRCTSSIGVLENEIQTEGPIKGYSKAFNETFADDEDGGPLPTITLPPFGVKWLPSLPLIGKKVDTIYYRRKEFNQQVAAHMAYQTLSHHIPQHMCPHHIEISCLQSSYGIAGITIATGGLIIGWAFPAAIVDLVSQIDYLTETVPWLSWIDKLPNTVLGLIQGVFPPLGLEILMALLPAILRAFAKLQENHTGMATEGAIQGIILSGITTIFQQLADNIASAPSILAQNLPKASYFFSYLPIVDSTARQKFTRATQRAQMKWGTFFPVYTNLACVRIIYSIISPLTLIFNVCTFSLFWMVYRYTLLCIRSFRFDTRGLLFPRAVNQLFTGIYVMEVCLIGLFFLVRGTEDSVSCFLQGIIVSAVTIFTVLYQYTLNSAFGPMLTYLPITLEDDTILRGGEFANDNERRRLLASGNIVPEEQQGDDLNEVLAELEKQERRMDQRVDEIGTRKICSVREKKKEGKSFFSRGYAEGLGVGDSEMRSRRPPPKKRPQTRPELLQFKDITDQIEALSQEERVILVGVAFQQEACHAKCPVIWSRSQGKVVYKRPPPDFDQLDLVEL
ncbi:DUF221-domain-containing protein [Tuber magnatum]|uniref:DUF221-domain-containing protein n=1 Tax=Tuber magnatum TaxID=42249 RepID=A0A317SW61_9PEZI|nr:DUF221-domain-containing protein [Tuber magnatum]